MKNKILAFLVILFLITAAAGIFAVNWYNDSVFSPAQNNDEEVELEVNEGDTLLSILPVLKEKGLVKSEEAIKLYIRLNNVSANIKVGTYTLPLNSNFPEIIKLLEEGVFKSSLSITLREGLRYEQIADILESEFKKAGEERKFSRSDFLEICENPDNQKFNKKISDFLSEFKPEGKPLRGFLFPDTYRFNVDATSLDVTETLLGNFQTKFEENNLRDINNNTLDNFYEVLTLASIIEKEASGKDDPAIISGVFYNRLADNYPLQADSTVNFITGKNDAGVLIADTKIDSPYNTYKYAGLTPSPINNPGLKSIKAALNPKETDFFFFVHDSEGNSYFAETYEEHQRNINLYL